VQLYDVWRRAVNCGRARGAGLERGEMVFGNLRYQPGAAAWIERLPAGQATIGPDHG
jgi:hypothetical protein